MPQHFKISSGRYEFEIFRNVIVETSHSHIFAFSQMGSLYFASHPSYVVLSLMDYKRTVIYDNGDN